MGNIQGNENKTSKSGKVKTLIKIRGKKGAKDDNQFVPIVVEDEGQVSIINDDNIEKDVDIDCNNDTCIDVDGEETPKLINDNKQIITTDSWCKVNKLNIDSVQRNKIISPGGESSSDSVFTDPQTPVGFAAEINECYYSEENFNDFTNNLTLNNFKLNEYRVRRENDLTKKLSKLGVSKTSQISLDGDNNESNFSSDNVEIINKYDDDSGISNNIDNSNVTKSSSSHQDITYTDSSYGMLLIKLIN